MAIPAQNTLTLTFTGSAGGLTLTSAENTAFRMDASTGITIPGSAALSNVSLNAGSLQLNFTAAYTGQVTVAMQVGLGSAFQVAGGFTPGSVVAGWVGQQGGTETLTNGSKLAID